MTDREKLIELLSENFCEYCNVDIVSGHCKIRAITFDVDRFADFLISNGVAIQKWIPVTERLPEELPKDGGAWSERVRPSVDVLVKIKGLKELYTAWYSYSYKEWTDVREERSFNGVTHWMPLPTPPEGECYGKVVKHGEPKMDSVFAENGN